MAQTTSTLWKTLLADPDAKREYAFEINGVWYGSEAEVEHSVEQSLYDAFGIGNATAATLSLTIFADDVPRGATIRRFIRLEKGETVSEWIPKNVFFANRRAEDNGVWTIEAFDAMRKSDFVWVPDQALEFPMKMTEAVSIFADIMGVEIDQRTDLNPSYTLDYPANNYTGRQILQFIAAANGGSFVISDDGKLRFIKSTGTEYTHDIGMDIVGFTDNGLEDPVSRVTLLVDNENEITAGDDSGFEIVADCPYANQGVVDALLSKLRGYRYQAYEAESANVDPAAEIGDQISVNGLLSVLARITDHGYGYPDIAAPGEAEMEEEYPFVSPLTQAFNRKIADTYSAIEKTSERISWIVASGDSESNFTLTDRTMELLTGELTISTHPIEEKENVVINSWDWSDMGGIDDAGVSKISGITYIDFGLSYDYQFFESKNAGFPNSVSYAIVWFDEHNEDRTVCIRCVNYAEKNYDYGIISNLDSKLDGNNRAPSSESDYYYSFYGKNSPDFVDVFMDIPGDMQRHFVTVKFVKDGSENHNDDKFKFMVYQVEEQSKTTETKISLNSKGVEISSANITFTGLVRFEDLSKEGATVINGANIMTETLYVTNVRYADESVDMDVLSSKSLGFGYGVVYLGDVSGRLSNGIRINVIGQEINFLQNGFSEINGAPASGEFYLRMSGFDFTPSVPDTFSIGSYDNPFASVYTSRMVLKRTQNYIGGTDGTNGILWTDGSNLYFTSYPNGQRQVYLI